MEIELKPSKNIFKEAQNNKASFPALIAELIDNSVASMRGNECNVTIEIRGPWAKGELDREKASIIIHDDSSGIQLSKLGEALSPAAMSGHHSDSLHEHGWGMKIAILSLGTKEQGDCYTGFKIHTKTEDENDTYSVSQLRWGKITVLQSVTTLFPKGTGTRIEIDFLKSLVPARSQDYHKLVRFLGHRYQYDLKNAYGKKLNMSLKLSDANGVVVKDTMGRVHEYVIKAIEPAYSGGKAEIEETIPTGKGAKNKKWSARVKFGFAPSDEELKNFSSEFQEHAKSGHPYHNRNKKIDLIYKGIVLNQVDFAWMGHSTAESIDRQYQKRAPRMQIFLEKGFDTTSSKDGLKESQHLEELKDAAWEIAKKFMTEMNRDETDIKDKLEAALRVSHPDLQREATPNAYGLRVDFSLTRNNQKEIWEVKAEEATGPDIIQLLGYLATSSVKNGVLLAPGWNSNAEALARDASQCFPGCTIELLDLRKHYSWALQK